MDKMMSLESRRLILGRITTTSAVAEMITTNIQVNCLENQFWALSFLAYAKDSSKIWQALIFVNESKKVGKVVPVFN
jgi:hypothetical protein